MSVKSGQAVTVLFATANATTGAAADASSTPTGTLYVNGTANGATVTVTNITTGVYKAALTLPSLTAGDVVSLRIAATVSAVAGEGIVWQEVADTKRVSDLNDLGGVAQTGDSYARLGAPAGASVSADIANVEGKVDAILVDTGTTLPAAIAAISASVGSGAGTYTDTVTDGTNPLDGVRVQLSTDSAKANPVYQAYTNALGVFLFHPDPGAYYVWFEKAGYDFSAVNGTGVTVT